MKTFKDFLAESKSQYSYRIKVAGDCPSDLFDSFKQRLEKYEPESISNPKKTPIQKSPAGFPELENEEVHIIDAVFNYPASGQEITELYKQAGGDPNRIRVLDSDYDDSVNQEAEAAEESPLLEKDYPDAPTEAIEAGNAHANAEVVMNSSEGAKFEVAGGTTPAAATTNDLPQGTNSPIAGTNKKPVPQSAAR